MEIENLTVVIPTYNRPDYLQKILRTIPGGIRVIVGDNGAFVPESLRLEFPEVIFDIRRSVIEPLANWNCCIEAVDSEWFIIPSDDDLYPEHSFDKVKNALEKYPDADLIIFGHKVIDENGHEISEWLPTDLKVFVPPYGFEVFKYGVEARFPSIIFRTGFSKEQGLFDESYKTTGGDSKFIQRCLLFGKSIFIPECLGAYRVWPQSSTTKTIASKQWLLEIDRWQDELAGDVKSEFDRLGIPIGFRGIKDEVYGRNMIQGLMRSGPKLFSTDKLRFVLHNRFPWKASFHTKFGIFKNLIR